MAFSPVIYFKQARRELANLYFLINGEVENILLEGDHTNE